MSIRNPQLTRQRLLDTAFHEIHTHGFQGMRVDEVLRLSGLQKGAFYHHFGSKTELGYAVLEEKVQPLMAAVWFKPLAAIEDPVRDLPDVLKTLDKRIPASILKYGCPLNNLAQEMAAQDDGFRIRVERIFDCWIDTLAQALERAKAAGYLRDDVDCQSTARFIVAGIEGCISIFKVTGAAEQWKAYRAQVTAYLAALSPHPHNDNHGG